MVEHFCEKMTEKDASKFPIHNYSGFMDGLKEQLGRDKYVSCTIGPSLKVYVISQCMEDLSDKECRVCFSQIINVLANCFPASSARVYLDGCFMRLENYSFHEESIGSIDVTKCGQDTEPEKVFKELVEEVIKNIVEKAPMDERGFAVFKETRNGISAYGMATCWRNLDKDMCSECLNEAASSTTSCLPSVEGRVLNAGCFLRYSHYQFANNMQFSKNESHAQIWLYITYAISAVIICIMAIGLGFFVGKVTYRKMVFRKMQKESEMDLSALHKSLQFLQFKYSTLERATDSFSESKKLGRGGFGEIFKGTLADGREIAIKRLLLNRKNQIKAICNEMDIMSRAHHKNLVRFLGCCFTKADSYVVSEYVANKSLDRILFDPEEKKELDWKKRLAIIIGTAEGLEYLHRSDVQIIHRDIKASNILLDLKHRPKIADFGLARFCSSEKSHSLSTPIAGTLGYMAPEYIVNGRLTEKVDVYSFGVLVLEIVSGVQNNKFQSENCFETVVTNTWKHFQANTESEIIDKSMKNMEEYRDEIERVVWVGLLCTQESLVRRPTMTSIIQMLKQKDTPLPLPSRPPFMDEWMELMSPSAGLASRRQSLQKSS
ncbi:putative cysteine-rich receptor-like protein kinase 43 [Pistacia vera]|uniref:putative cysteine-rich receptor-like protein kinase 43 n=1 Tax=Pistacia vera TaxID=55513 RepID=UPI001262FE26|nr:putative cysteine-rich receptor-like protein kinase 43 [Pistacia vera]